MSPVDSIGPATDSRSGSVRPPGSGSVAPLSLSFNAAVPPTKLSADYWPQSFAELHEAVEALGGYGAFTKNGYGLSRDVDGGQVNVFITHVPTGTPSELDRYLAEKIEEASA